MTSPRRIRVERGIYKRQASTGWRYQITWIDSEGRQCWETIKSGGLKQARSERADRTSKAARGERVTVSRVKLREFASEWLSRQSELRPRTLSIYESHLRVHVYPRLGRRRVSDIHEDDVAELIAELRRQGLSGWTIHGVLTPLSRVFAHAARRGLRPDNPVANLEKGERPSVGRREMRVLDSAEIARLLEASPDRYRTLIALAVFTGLRQSEALGLTWRDADLDAGVLHVRKQLDRGGGLVEPKTPGAVRDVRLWPALRKMLLEHKAASRFKLPSDYVFASRVGSAPSHRNVIRDGFVKAVEGAELEGDGKPKLRWHDLRHTAGRS